MNLIKILQKLIRYKLIWWVPSKSDILIIDNCHKELIMDVLDSWSVSFVNTRDSGEMKKEINMICLLFAIMKIIYHRDFRNQASYFNNYIDSYIQLVKPKLVVTTIDNNINFYTISKRNAKVKTMLIQNASRYYYGALEYLAENKNSRDSLKVDYMITLGINIGSEYYGKYIEGDVVPIGSLKNNMIYCDNVLKKSNTIAFASQYRTDIGEPVFTGQWFSYDEYFNKPNRFVVMYLMDYAKKNGKEFVIIPCANDSTKMKEELEYYKELTGEECLFSRYRYGNYKESYCDVDSVEVLVTIDSTLGYECVARGGKNAFFHVRSNIIGQDEPYRTDFGWPKEYPDVGPFWTNLPDVNIFDRILDYLFQINNDDWSEELIKYDFDNIITYDRGNSRLLSVLDDVI